MTQTLFDRLNTSGRLPTPPGVVLQLLDLTRREDVSVREIADTIAMDPGLTAKILRFANSPMAGIAREITSIQHAVAMMGVRGVKMTALSFAVLGTAGSTKCKGFDAKQFGLQSLGCGVAARALASTVKDTSPQEAFVGGLLSQIGRSALASGLPEEYATILLAAKQVPRDLPGLEMKVFGQSYATIGGQLLRNWGIPEALCQAIARFRDDDISPDDPVIVRALRVAEIAAGIICPDTKGDPPDTSEFVEAAHKLFGIEAEDCAAMLSEMAAEIDDTRGLLELPKANLRSPDDIQSEVRERIAELSLAMHLENQSMAQQQEDLMRRATTDALTGVGNRAAFDARMQLELERSARSGSPFSLLMIDVDKFKVFNDTYGHQTGDSVLKNVASVLDANVRKVDCVARYGGEEFGVIAPETPPEGAINLAERLRHAVESAESQCGDQILKVTISIGVATFMSITEAAQAPAIIRAADSQLYAAKRAGRNRVELTVDGAPAPMTSCAG